MGGGCVCLCVCEIKIVGPQECLGVFIINIIPMGFAKSVMH